MTETTMANSQQTRIVLIRHGQTVWNRDERFRGQTDVALDAMGLAQAEATGRYVARRWPVSIVYTSPLKRAFQTAEAIARPQGVVVEPTEYLIDIHFGDWQGELAMEIARRNPDLIRAWMEAPHTVRFPGGESLEIVRHRLTEMLNDLLPRHAGETIALVGHSVVNRVLLCIVLGWGNERFWRVQQDTCAVNVFDAQMCGADITYTVYLINDTGHLEHLSDAN